MVGSIALGWGLGDVVWGVDGAEVMFIQEIDEALYTAAFILAEVVMDVPGEVIASEVRGEFGLFLDEGFEGFEAEGFGFAEDLAEWCEVRVSLEDPDGVDEGEAGEVGPGAAEVPRFVGMAGEEEAEGAVADHHEAIGQWGIGVGVKGEELGVEVLFGEEDFEEEDTCEGVGIAVDGLDFAERCFMGEEDTFDFAEGGDGDAVQDIVVIIADGFGDAEEGGIELVIMEGLGELGWGEEGGFLVEAPGEGEGIEVGDGADTEVGGIVFEGVFLGGEDATAFAFVAVGEFFGGLDWGHAQWGYGVAHGVVGVGSQTLTGS
jgi:hypothetical protein